MQPDWSPDGRWIAFHSRRRGGIWIVPSTGGAPRQIVERGSTPRGRRTASVSSTRRKKAARPASRCSGPCDRDGTGRRQLTQLGHPAGGHNHPAWSQNGRFIAFVVSNGVVNNGDLDRRRRRRDAAAADVGTGRSTIRSSRRTTRAVYWTGKAASSNGRLFRIGFDAATGTGVGDAVAVMPFENGDVRGTVDRAQRIGGVRRGDGRRESLDDRSRRGGRRLGAGAAHRRSRPQRPPGLFARRAHRVPAVRRRPAAFASGRWTRTARTGRRCCPRRRPVTRAGAATEPGARAAPKRRNGRRRVVGRPRVATRHAHGRCRGRDIRSPRLSPDSQSIAFHAHRRERRDERLDAAARRRTTPAGDRRSRSDLVSRVVAGRTVAGARSEARRAHADRRRAVGRRRRSSCSPPPRDRAGRTPGRPTASASSTPPSGTRSGISGRCRAGRTPHDSSRTSPRRAATCDIRRGHRADPASSSSAKHARRRSGRCGWRLPSNVSRRTTNRRSYVTTSPGHISSRRPRFSTRSESSRNMSRFTCSAYGRMHSRVSSRYRRTNARS